MEFKMQRDLSIIIFILLFINIFLIDISISMPYELIGDWERASNENELYPEEGWTTYSIITPRIAELKILEEGDFHFAWKMNKLESTNKLHFKNKLLGPSLEFKGSSYYEVNKNDILKWVFSVAEGGQIWIAFPPSQITTLPQPCVVETPSIVNPTVRAVINGPVLG
jgi:hypothetical protein